MIKLILKLRNAHEADIADLKLAQQARKNYPFIMWLLIALL
jgi:hypothetical protein